MELNHEMLQRFVGGQLEIQNQIEGYLYRGEVEEASVDGEELNVKFKWMAKADAIPPSKWTNEENTSYAVNLMTANASENSKDRIVINTGFVSHEILVFFLPTGSKLDPSKVEGLEIV